MGDATPWFFFMHSDEPRTPPSNESMVKNLVNIGTLSQPECIDAFKAVDRRHFWPAGSGDLAYADMPLRSGCLHISAPHIYAKALESLMPLSKGMSFLNIGSGTGYFNSVVSELIGNDATNNGVEIWEETTAHARSRCAELGKDNLEFTTGNVYELDVTMTSRYDRIYLGACANSRSKYLYRLLEVGGILVGPFQVGNHSQQLRRVVRASETQFNVECLGSVQFASLVEPNVPTPLPPSPTMEAPTPVFAPQPRSLGVFTPPPPPRGAATPRSPVFVAPSAREGVPAQGSGTTTPGATDDSGQAIGLAGIPFTFSLSEKPWTEERCWLYPAAYRNTVVMALLSRPCDSSAPCIPTEIWVKHIFPWCPKWWFDAKMQASSAESPAVSTTPTAAMGGLSCRSLAMVHKAKGEAVLESHGDSMEYDPEHSDDGGFSTTASSCGGGVRSLDSTPESGPSAPPPGLADEVDEEGSSSSVAMDLGAGSVLFELLPDGRRHAIGTEGDPDDDTQPQASVRVLQMIAADAQRRRRRRQQLSWDGSDMEDEEPEEPGRVEPVGREEDEMEDGDEFEEAESDDDMHVDVEGEEEDETDESEDEGDDMPAL